MSLPDCSPFPAYRPPTNTIGPTDCIDNQSVQSGWAGVHDLNRNLPPSRTVQECGPLRYAAYIGSTVKDHKTLPDGNVMISLHDGDEWRFRVSDNDNPLCSEDGQVSKAAIRLNFHASLDQDGTAVISIVPVDVEESISNREIADSLRICLRPGSTVDIKCHAASTLPDLDTGYDCVLPWDVGTNLPEDGSVTVVNQGGMESNASIWMRSEGYVGVCTPESVLSEIASTVYSDVDSLVDYRVSQTKRNVAPRTAPRPILPSILTTHVPVTIHAVRLGIASRC